MKAGKKSTTVTLNVTRFVASLATLVMFLLAPAGQAQQSKAPKRVLVLYWYGKDFPANVEFDRSFQNVLHSAPTNIEYCPEYLETNRFPGEDQALLFRDYLRRKYADRTIDVIAASGYVPLDFLVKYRDELFPHTPIVFLLGTYPSPEELATGPGMTGIVVLNTYRQTLDLALRLHPSTEQVFIVSGTLERDKKYETAAREQLEGFGSRVRINYLTDLQPDELIAKIKSLTERSVVLYVWQMARNPQGQLLEATDVLSLIVQSAQVPIYRMTGSSVGNGIVGGYVFTDEANANRMAEIALRIANGTRAQDIAVEDAPSVPMFDWRQLQRWSINERDLPPGSVMRFKTTSLWEDNKKYVIGGLTLILILSGLVGCLLFERRKRLRSEDARLQLAAIVESSRDAIIGVSLTGEILTWNKGAELMYGYIESEMLGRHISIVVPHDHRKELLQCLRKLAAGEPIENFETVRLKKDGGRLDVSVSVSVIKDAKDRTVAVASIGRDISERKRVEAALRESEARFRNMADTAPVLVWMSGPDGLCTYFNRAWLEFTGRTMEQEFANGWAEGVHQSDYERCFKTYVTAFDARESYCMEYRLRRHDGEYRWIVVTGVPHYAPDGTFAGYIGSAIDITERKRNEQELQRLAVRLLNLQDAERRRLARELHDVTAQNLFATTLNLARLQRGVLEPSEAASLIAESRQLCDQALQEIRTLSYVLHPPMLDQAGLVGALRWYVEGFVKRSGINVELISAKDVGRLARDVETALFRVLQESLTNIRRHSESSSAHIRLERQQDQIILQITDYGHGMSKLALAETSDANTLGVGIPGMRQRLRQFGGTLHIESNGRGMVVTATVPAKGGVIDDSDLDSRRSRASA